MDNDRYPRHDVLCIDMRSFYASVEAVKRGLDPMQVQLAVVGDVNRPGSIVLAASPTLKNKHGLTNVSRFFELPKDPEIIIAPAHMADYLQVSLEITKLLHQYVPKNAIHQYSVDEIWVTVDGLEKLFGGRWQIAKSIKHDILENFGITCSIGIGDNKFLAKTIMDLHAKKLGIAECTYEDVKDKLWPFPVQDIWGIGRRMQQHLNRMGIITLGQLAQFPFEQLSKRFGIIGEQLYWHAWGIDLSPVFGQFTKTEQKGFGHGISLLRDYTSEEVPVCIHDLCEEVCRRARDSNKAGKTIHISITYAQESGGGFSRSRSIDTPTNITMDVYNICMQLFYENYDGLSNIRHVYVTLSHLSEDNATQLNLFANKTKQKDLDQVLDTIRAKYGEASILRASSYTKAGVTIERSSKIGGHQA